MLPRYFNYLKDIIYREPTFILKYYLHRGCLVDDIPEYVLMADGKMVHGGLFDRLKGIISIYALSKVQNKYFGIYFKHPFDLSDYLRPASYDWTISDDKVFYSYPLSRPVIAYSENKNPVRLLKYRTGQIHYYFGGDILETINKMYGTDFQWKDLYHELFTPTKVVLDYVNERKTEIGTEYDAVHLRFVNLLGDNIEANQYQALNDDEQKLLVSHCVEKLRILNCCCKDKGKKLAVASDSMTFLKIVKDLLPEMYIVSGQVKHIDKVKEATVDDVLKLFADMYLLAGAVNVYSIVGEGLYASAFPEYSAKIGCRPFERILL